MALIVEDGTGLATAEAYVSVADADTYWTARPTEPNVVTWTGATTANKESALRVGAEWLDMTFGQSWRGRSANETQALDWPRESVIDDDGRLLSRTSLPVELVRANIEAGLRVLVENVDSDSMVPDQDSPGTISRERVRLDVLEVDTTYLGGASQQTMYVKIRRMLAPLTESSATVLRG